MVEKDLRERVSPWSLEAYGLLGSFSVLLSFPGCMFSEHFLYWVKVQVAGGREAILCVRLCVLATTIWYPKK